MYLHTYIILNNILRVNVPRAEIDSSRVTAVVVRYLNFNKINMLSTGN